MADYARLLISKVLREHDLKPVLEAGIKKNWFEDKDHRRAFNWLTEYYSRYGESPTVQAFKREFPTYRLIKVNEPFHYYVDRFIDLRERTILVDTVIDVDAQLKEGDHKAAQAEMSKGLMRLGQEVSILSDQDITSNLRERYEDYKSNRHRSGHLVGIPTGFPTLDLITGGYQPEQFILFGGLAKAGKAQPFHTPVLTPVGWKQLGNVVPGDQVIGKNGTSTRVTHTWDWGSYPLLRVTTDDGASTLCTAEHEWEVLLYRPYLNKQRVMSTEEIQNWLLTKNSPLYLPICDPIHFAAQEPLPLDPYLVGALIGDGGLISSVTFHKPFPWFTEKLSALVPVGVSVYHVGRHLTIGAGMGRSNPVKELLTELGLWGHKSPSKFIPHIYKRAPIEDRLALLRGLMDTDGTMERNSATYTTTSSKLADDLVELVQSLGGVTHRTVKPKPFYRDKTGKKVIGLPAHRIVIRIPAELGNPFDWPVKAKRWASGNDKRSPSRRIVSVEPAGKEPVRCLTVGAADGLYVIENYFVTHNSMMLMRSAIAAQDYNKKVLFFTFEMSLFEQLCRYDGICCRVNNLHLLHGILDNDELRRLRKGMSLRRNMPSFIISSDISGSTTLSGMAAKIEQHQPDIVFIDGVYLMENEVGAQPMSPQAYTAISRGVKRLAQRTKKPIVAVTQVSPQKVGKGGEINLSSWMWANSWQQDADLLMGVEPVEGAPLIRLRTVAGRNVAPRLINVSCNWDEAQLDEVELLEDDDD